MGSYGSHLALSWLGWNEECRHKLLPHVINNNRFLILPWIRIIEYKDDKDSEELWLYIRKYEDGRIKYAVSDAPTDIDIQELHHAATLRWSIEQSFQECKSFLGMADYETRSYVGWHRHILLVMVAHLFVLEVRHLFQKKN